MMERQEWIGKYGLVLRHELVPGRATASTVDKAVSRRTLVPLQRGIYLPAEHEVGAIDLARSAWLAANEFDSAVSHTTAARMHRLVVPDTPGPAHITIPRPTRRPHHRRLVLHTARLPDPDVVEIDGLPVTSVARTLVDLCRLLPRTPAVWAVEQALRRSLVTVDELVASSFRLDRTPGIVQARERLVSADPRSESPLETAARLRLSDAGIPPSDLQIPVALDGGSMAYLDMGYQRERIGIELDGREVHEAPAAVFRDRRRQNAVVAEGWQLLRFTWFDVVHDADRFVAEVRRNLKARRR